MRDRAPSSNNRRPAPGALPRVPARAGADPHLAATLRCGAGRGGEQPCGKRQPGGQGCWAALVPLFANADTKHGPHAGPTRSLTRGAVPGCPTGLPSACSPAPRHRGAQPRGLQRQRAHPGHCEQPAVPGPPAPLCLRLLLHRCACASCTALPGLGGAQLTAPGPHGLQAPAPCRAGAEQQPPACSGCWGPAAPTPHSRLPRAARAARAPFPSASPGAGPQPCGPVYC